MASILGVSALHAQPVDTRIESNARRAELTLVQSNNRFAFDLYKRHAFQKKNVFFSPYSLTTAMGMVADGARGATADEMRRVLHFTVNDGERRVEAAVMIKDLNSDGSSETDPAGKQYELKTANALWVKKDFAFEAAYLDLIKTVYSGYATALDFTADTENARITINDWVAAQTNNRIRDLVAPGVVSADTRLVLTNAVYFKGAWAEPFDKSATAKLPFFTGDTAVQADMMRKNADYLYMENEKVQMVALPYRGERLSMVLILPLENDLARLETELNPDMVLSWRAGMARESVDLAVPKFELATDLGLGRDLREMGMMSAFINGTADFSGMTGTRGLFISQVVHKAWVKVDEEGSEAAAASAVMMNLTGIPGQHPKVFHADHPFIVLIQDDVTGQILFMGRVSDPTAR